MDPRDYRDLTNDADAGCHMTSGQTEWKKMAGDDRFRGPWSCGWCNTNNTNGIVNCRCCNNKRGTTCAPKEKASDQDSTDGLSRQSETQFLIGKSRLKKDGDMGNTSAAGLLEWTRTLPKVRGGNH
jgi:hypothetical protein